MAKNTKPRPSLEDIKGAIAVVFNIEASKIDVTGKSNKFAHPRAAVIFIARDIGLTNQEIADNLSYKRAGTVSQLHSKAINWKLANLQGFETKLGKVRTYLRQAGFNVKPQSNLELRQS